MDCPRCGAKKVKLIAGIKCPACDHVVGSQNLSTDWSQFDNDLGRTRVKDADGQSRASRAHNPKRRYPLKFDKGD